MSAAHTTIWDIEPHTQAKHAILRGYLEAWFPILASTGVRIVYFDGFAGPGRYSKGEDGSPVIALNVALHHRAKLKSEIAFVFVEQKKARADSLQSEIEQLKLPKNFRVEVAHNEFAPVLKAALDRLDSTGHRMAPTFAFIDPFGITGLPFALVERLLHRKSCEVLVTFMTTAVQRFVSVIGPHVNDLIGDSHAAPKIEAASDRVLMARTLYTESLLRVASFVRFFQLRDAEGRPIYDLFFATNSSKGHEKMKEAMWKVDESGAYSFADSTNPTQTVLFTPNPGADLASYLRSHFAGRAVDAVEVIRYVLNKTTYLRKHASAALRSLEAAGSIDVAGTKEDGTKRRRGDFPQGTRVRFVRHAGEHS